MFLSSSIIDLTKKMAQLVSNNVMSSMVIAVMESSLFHYTKQNLIPA